MLPSSLDHGHEHLLRPLVGPLRGRYTPFPCWWTAAIYVAVDIPHILFTYYDGYLEYVGTLNLLHVIEQFKNVHISMIFDIRSIEMLPT